MIPANKSTQNPSQDDSRSSYSVSLGTTPRSGQTGRLTFDDDTLRRDTIIEEGDEFYDSVSPFEVFEDEDSGEVCPSDPKHASKKTKKGVRHILRKANRAQIIYILLVAVVVLMLNADQNLLAPSLSMIASEFNMTSEEKDLKLGGYLSIAFFASGGFAAMIAGFLADISDRKTTFSAVVFIGELSCLCTIFVQDFWGLFATRLVTGFAIGGSSPVLYSLIGDTFVDEWRGRAASLFILLSGGGVLVGQSVAALIAPTFGWRVPFAVVSIPALICTILFYCCVEEPKRGSQERVLKTVIKEAAKSNVEFEPYNETMTLKKLWMLFGNRTVMILLWLSLPASLPWGFLLVYAQDFIVHDIGPQIGGVSSAESLAVVIIFAVGSGIGNLIGGFLTDYLWRRKRFSSVAFMSGITTALGAIPMYFTVNVRLTYVGYCLIVFPSGFLVALGGLAKNSMLLNCTLPETRGTAFAINTLLDDLGRGFGSFLIAMMIVGLGGRVPAFNVAFAGWLLAGFMFCFTSFTIKKDLEARNEQLLATMKVAMDSKTTTTSAASAITKTTMATDEEMLTDQPTASIQDADDSDTKSEATRSDDDDERQVAVV